VDLVAQSEGVGVLHTNFEPLFSQGDLAFGLLVEAEVQTFELGREGVVAHLDWLLVPVDVVDDNSVSVQSEKVLLTLSQ